MRRLSALLVILSLLACGVANAQSAATAQAERKAGRMQSAAQIAMPLAEAGDAEAQRIIGEMYFEGQGLPVSKTAAFKWNLAAAQQGDRLAQYSVGYLYETGQGVAASQEQAMEYYRRSALQRYVPAQIKLGDLYRERFDEHLAIHWYEQAMQLGSEEARTKFSQTSSAQQAGFARAREVERARENEEKLARYGECARMCPVATQRARCESGENDPRGCTQDDYEAIARRPSNASVAGEVQARLAEIQRSNARIVNSAPPATANTPALPFQRGRADGQLSASGAQTEQRSSPSAAAGAQGGERDVVESNPYERYGSSPSAWGDAIQGWNAVVGQGANRAQACSAATANQSQRMARDEAAGIVRVSDRTGCICGSYRSMGNMTFAMPQWQCGAYYKTQETGKKAGAVSR